MLIPPRAYRSHTARNRAFDAVVSAVGLCESLDQLEQLREEYAHDLTNLADDAYGTDIQAAIAEAFSAQAAIIKHKSEFSSC